MLVQASALFAAYPIVLIPTYVLRTTQVYLYTSNTYSGINATCPAGGHVYW